MAATGSIADDCPDPALIATFAGRGLTPVAAARVEAHLAECDDCRTLVFALASGDGGASAPVAASSELLRVGRFRVIDTLGHGAMGVVYRARDEDLDRMVAVKVSRSHSKLDVGGEDRLRREAQALARLVHQNVVSIHEIGQHEGRAYVAMEYVDGVTLDAWIAERPPVSTVIDVLVGAARGLAAAHAAGLVHRDVKPSNIFVARGIAKIGDFGLVRFGPAESGARAVAERSDLEMTLSVTGSIVGTPAYMAPEQLSGEVATEASDQFSFCVTMFEALHGRRPFAGDTLRDLRAAFEVGVAKPASATVPAWIATVLARGLSVAAANRWPSMTALADALEDDPAAARRRRQKQVAVGGALTLFAGVAVAAVMMRGSGTSTPPCAGFETTLAGVWDPARSQQLREAFAASALPYAADTFARVAAQLDGYGRGWVSARVDACKATRVRGDQSEAQMELRMACLDRRLIDLGALVGVLGTTSTSVIDNAITATQALAPLADCANLPALVAGIQLPADASVRTRVLDLQRQLATVTALYETGQYTVGLAKAREVVTAAEPLHFAPVLAEALHLRARLEDGSGDPAAAAATYEIAIPAAGDARDDVRAAQIWTDLVHVLGLLGRTEHALELRPAVEAAFKRAGSPPALEIKLLTSYGDVYMAQGNPADAQPPYERALAINDKALGPTDHRFASTILNNLGIAQQQQGQFAESVKTYRRALAIDEVVLGPDHPQLAMVLVNIGVGLASQGDYDGGRPYDLRALAILEKALGPDHPSVGAALDNIGAGYLSQGRYDEARPYQLRAIAIFEKADGETNADLAGALTNLGVAYLAQENYAEGRRAAQRSLAIYEKVGGANHPTLGAPLLLLGAIDGAEGHHDAGLASYQRALAISEKALGPDHPDVASALTGIAQESLALGKFAAARIAAERALVIRAQPDMPAFELAETRFALARALWAEPAGRKRARTLADQAREGFVASADAGTKSLAELGTWLREHPSM